MLNNLWGVPRQTYKLLSRSHNKTFLPPYKTDSPEQCTLGPSYWNNYSNKNYNYTFNSWGFRGEDYEQYLEQEVNICIGDSTTVNLGGPIEHSWPYQLSEYFNIPTLNISIDGCCFYDFDAMIKRVKTYYKVNKIFVLYNLYDNDTEWGNSVSLLRNNSDISTKINALKNHCWIHGAYWQFDPPWTFFKDELTCLYEHFPEAHDYFRNFKMEWKNIDYVSAISSEMLNTEYQKIAGSNWISYSKFIELLIISPDYLLIHFTNPMDKKLILEFLTSYVSKLITTNRDGYHMSELSNRLLADYFYKQTLITSSM